MPIHSIINKIDLLSAAHAQIDSILKIIEIAKCLSSVLILLQKY